MSQAVLSETEIGGGGGGMGDATRKCVVPEITICFYRRTRCFGGRGGFIHQLVNEGIKIRRSGWECLTIR